MPVKDDDDDAGRDQQAPIEELKRKASEITGGKMKSMETEDVDPNISEQFWKQVIEFESASTTTDFKELEDAGVILPAPDELDDETLSVKLWALIGRLAKMRTFVHSTNHLSDRELYEHLWRDSLREEKPNITYNKYSAWNIDIIGSGSEEDTYLWMKYYANEETRQRWQADWPDYEMPPHEDPPYNRDAFIPQATYANPDENGADPGFFDFDIDDEEEMKM